MRKLTWSSANYFASDVPRLLGDLGSPLWRHVGGAILATLGTKLFCGGALAVVLHVIGFLAGVNAHDADGIADLVGGALLALGPLGIAHSLFQSNSVGKVTDGFLHIGQLLSGELGANLAYHPGAFFCGGNRLLPES